MTGSKSQTKPFAAVILAAGQGTRMKSAKSKVLHEVGGLSLIGHVLHAVEVASAAKVVVVVSKDGEAVSEHAKGLAANVETVIQDPPLGTGHAVQAALPALDGFSGHLLVVFGDTPLIRPEFLERLVGTLDDGHAVAVTGFSPLDPLAYGRLITDGELDGDGCVSLNAIVEFKDASEAERQIDFCNGGIMALHGDHARELLASLTDDNANKEYYLTDVVAAAKDRGLTCVALDSDPDEVLGINARLELAEAESIFQERARIHAMEQGVTLLDPYTAYFSYDTKLGQDVVVGQNVVFAPGVTIGDNVTIKAFSHLEGATVDAAATVGPYARLRPGAHIGQGAKIGNFVEIKKAHIEQGSKVPHLSYIGDARVGAGSNIGAGTITCNYDGFNKFFTDIGEAVFVGSNSSLVAPVKIGDGANVAAGSVVTKDVEADALAVTRADQKNLAGWAPKYRAKKQVKKEAKKKS